MRWIHSIVWAFLVGFILVLGYTNRALLFSRFDESYWKNRYEQSQWVLPMSARTLGDDGLFLYEGYRLLQGDDVTRYNPEVPPLGKYIIGASIHLLGNGYWYGALVTTGYIIAFYVLARTLLPTPLASVAATLLFATDPLVTGQFTLTMLDSLQLLFALLFFLSILPLVRGKRMETAHARIILSGVFLGLFSETKFPLAAPLLLSIGMWTIWKQKSRALGTVLFLGAVLGAYLLPYLPYFLTGHTLREWLQLQKASVSFYTNSTLAPTIGSAFTALLFNRSQDLFSRAWEYSAQWSPLWPFAFFTTCLLWLRKRTIPPTAGILGFFTITTLILYSFVPFWNRYLLLVLPFLYLSVGALLATIRRPTLTAIIAGFFFFINLGASWSILFPPPATTVRQFLYDWQHGFFADMYERISKDTQSVSREEFTRFGKETFANAEIEAVTVELNGADRVRLTYHTRRLGSFTHDVTLPVVQEEGQWKIAWRWDLLLPELALGRTVTTSVIEAARGTIRNDQTVLAADVPGFMVWITPKDVDVTREQELLAVLASSFLQPIKEVRIHHRYVGDTLSDLPIAIGVVAANATQTIRELKQFTGVTLTPARARWHNPASPVDLGQLKNTAYDECCSWLYTTTSYDGVSAVEGQYNKILKGKNGGTLALYDENGIFIRMYITNQQQDGKDVTLKAP